MSAVMNERGRVRLHLVRSCLIFLGVPVACHLSFSWLGFNPTDDGWLLAVARRILDGEVPHRDFVFIRPALSAVIQVPLVLLGGDRVVWLSRLWGWMCLGVVAWIWTGLAMAPRRSGSTSACAAGQGPHERYFVYGCAVFLSAHTFPVMAWHSIDGMLFGSLAALGMARGMCWGTRLAFVAAGAAALCRQNFVFLVPTLLLVNPRSIRRGDFLWAAVPGLLYVGIIASLGASLDLLEQIRSTGGWLLSVAIKRYAVHSGLCGSVAAGFGLALAVTRIGRTSPRAARSVVTAALVASSVVSSVCLWQGAPFLLTGAFGLFGLSTGVGAWAVIQEPSLERRVLVVGGLGLVWATSISVGYNTPALGAGVAFVILWASLASLLPTSLASGSWMRTATGMAATVLIGASLVHARYEYPYRDRPAVEARHALGNVVPGLSGLSTNASTHAVLADLVAVRRQLEQRGSRYAVLTSFSATWVRNAQANPLPVEWAQGTELARNPRLIRRVTESIQSLPADYRIVAERYQAAMLGRDLVPVPRDHPYFVVQNWVRSNCRKEGETEYFEIYLPPSAVAPRDDAPGEVAGEGLDVQ